MRAKVCYTLSPKLYHKCKPIATNRSAFPRRPRASSPYRRCTKSDRSHDSSRVQGELRSALRHTLDPAAPTTCDRDSVHRLPTLAEAHSARDDEDSAPPSPPTSNSTRNVSSAARKHEALTGGSFPFEAVIARNTIPSIEARLRSPIFHDASRWLCVQTHNRVGRRGRAACGHAQPALTELALAHNARYHASRSRLRSPKRLTRLPSRRLAAVRIPGHAMCYTYCFCYSASSSITPRFGRASSHGTRGTWQKADSG